MPWNETCVMDERVQFIAAWKSGEWDHSALCERFGISRKTGYKWISRYQLEGVKGLQDRSREPHHHPHALGHEMVRYLLSLKHRFPRWGPRKIRDWLLWNRPGRRWPAASTIGAVYDRHGLVKPRQRRVRSVPRGEPLGPCEGPNDVWATDFKGHFRLGCGAWCYPLTLSDNDSRLLLLCQGLVAPTEALVWPCFRRAFEAYGLPWAIRHDSGSPFASVALGGLTRLSVWWLKLGIRVERIAPGRPDQNGRHERMHRTLKEETASPPKANRSAQQRAFNRFRAEYNTERPHESLDGVPPLARYERSPRPYPRRVPQVEYGDGFVVRRVRSNGQIKWRGGRIFVSEALRGEPVGLVPCDNECWQLYFSHLLLGIMDERVGRIIRPA